MTWAEVAPLVGPKDIVSAVVYYIWSPANAAIKIGRTITLRRRLGQIRNSLDDRNVALLALEPGGEAVERARHEQFRSIRVRRRGQGFSELFNPTPDLLQHVAAMRAGWEAGLLRTFDDDLLARWP